MEWLTQFSVVQIWIWSRSQPRICQSIKLATSNNTHCIVLRKDGEAVKTMEWLLVFCQTIYSDCQSSPVMSDVDNIFVTRGDVVFYVASCITRTLRVRGGAGSAVVSSSDMVTARRTIRNRIFYPGPFLDYQCFHQSL